MATTIKGSATMLTPIATTVFKPTKPMFGGIREVCKDSWVPWTGGEPLSNWLGFANPTAEVEANQYCPSSIISAGKKHHDGTTGLQPQFEKSHDLKLLKMNMNQHIETHG